MHATSIVALTNKRILISPAVTHTRSLVVPRLSMNIQQDSPSRWHCNDSANNLQKQCRHQDGDFTLPAPILSRRNKPVIANCASQICERTSKSIRRVETACIPEICNDLDLLNIPTEQILHQSVGYANISIKQVVFRFAPNETFQFDYSKFSERWI